MSDYIPWEIQSQIIKSLPVKSLVQFRSVSKQWKSFIDCLEFIKNYHINHPNPQHHLLVEYNTTVRTFTSIVDDNTFPRQKFPLTAPELLNSLRHTKVLSSVGGLICFHGSTGSYEDLSFKNSMVVLWNPSVRKCVGIPIPKVLDSNYGGDPRIGFGVCPETWDPTLVKIHVLTTPVICWEVQVFTLSSRVWKTVYTGVPLKWCYLLDHVCIDGVIYWRTTAGRFLMSFDLKSHKFGEVCIPEILDRFHDTRLTKVNESLVFLQYPREVCGVWMRKCGVNEPFTEIYTVKIQGRQLSNKILGFRKNGEVVMTMEDDNYLPKSHIAVYEPSSGLINSVGISGHNNTFSSVWSYMETLLLLDESNSIIH